MLLGCSPRSRVTGRPRAKITRARRGCTLRTNMGSRFGSALVGILVSRLQASCEFQQLHIGFLKPTAEPSRPRLASTRRQRLFPTCYIEALSSPEKLMMGQMGCPLQSQVTSTVGGGRSFRSHAALLSRASPGDLLPDFGCPHRKTQDLCILVSSNGSKRCQIGRYVAWTAQFFVICM